MSETQKSVEGASAQKLVSEFMRELPSDQLFDTREVIRAHPVIQNHHSAFVDLAYEEYSRRRQRGERIDPEEFARQFPAVQGTLLQLASLDKYFDRHAQSSEQSGQSVWPAVGDNYLEFDLLEELGGGRFSRVFLAREMELGERTVVLKVCYTGEDEAQTLGRLQHPNIVPVNSVRHDFSTNLSAISLQYMGRSTLGDVLNRLFVNGSQPKRKSDLIAAVKQINRKSESSLPTNTSDEHSADRRSYVDAVIRMGSQIADALAYSHSMGIFHGDIKPSNILVTDSGDSLLFDFNLAVNPQTGGGRVGGTLPYMSPEQLTPIRDSGEFSADSIDARTEIFSLGVTLYEALCGQHPFGPIPEIDDRKEFAAALLKQQQAGAKPIRELNPQVDPILAALIDSALQLDPNQRPETADRFAHALKSLDAPHQRARRCLFNHPRLSLAAVIFTLAATVSGIAVWQSLPSQHEREMTSIREAYDAERFADVVTVADEVLATSPNCLRTRFFKAHSLMNSGQYGEARTEFEILHNQRPSDAFVVQALSYCLVCDAITNKRSRPWAEADAMLEGVNDSTAKDAGYFNNLGYCRLQERRYQDAEMALRRSLHVDDSSPRVRLLLAEIERRWYLAPETNKRDEHLAEALQQIELAMKSAESTAEGSSLMADSYYQLGITHAAAAKRLLRQSPDKAAERFQEAVAAFQSGVDHGLGEKQLRIAVTIESLLEKQPGFDEVRERAASNPPASRLRWLMAPPVTEEVLPLLPCE